MFSCVQKSAAKIRQRTKRRFPLLEKSFPYFENASYQSLAKAIFRPFLKKNLWREALALPARGGNVGIFRGLFYLL